MCRGSFSRLVAAVTAGASWPPSVRLLPLLYGSALVRPLWRREEALLGRGRYVLFIHTTQRLTRARRLPALKVSDWGFLNISFCSTMASQKL